MALVSVFSSLHCRRRHDASVLSHPLTSLSFLPRLPFPPFARPPKALMYSLCESGLDHLESEQLLPTAGIHAAVNPVLAGAFTGLVYKSTGASFVWYRLPRPRPPSCLSLLCHSHKHTHA